MKGELGREALPATREEFEARAILFQVLLELEEFLRMKREFVAELTAEETRKFWQCNAEGRIR